MLRRVPRELRPLVRLALRSGWSLSFTGAGHLQLHSPHGAVVVSGGTPSDWRSHRNTRAQLRRAGLAC